MDENNMTGEALAIGDEAVTAPDLHEIYREDETVFIELPADYTEEGALLTYGEDSSPVYAEEDAADDGSETAGADEPEGEDEESARSGRAHV